MEYLRRLKQKIYKKVKGDPLEQKYKAYFRRFRLYSFNGSKCIDYKQYQAVIIRWYHTIEKGLAFPDYKAGFGKNNIEALVSALENYLKDGYSNSSFFFSTAVDVLEKYIEKNKAYGVKNIELEERVRRLQGSSNHLGGTIEFVPVSSEQAVLLNYENLVKNRHSMRHFSEVPVEMNQLLEAIELAQFTPSACNRQGWRTIVVSNHDTMEEVLKNQNGNRGFGQEFDKILVVVADLRCFNRDREIYQAFIDGGMYAESILNSLHFKGIASIPLSAALTNVQEYNMRKILKIHDAEELIMFIGVGNYPEMCITARSERKKPEIEII